MPAGEKSVEEGYSSLEIAAESGAEETATPDLDAAASQNEEKTEKADEKEEQAEQADEKEGQVEQADEKEEQAEQAD